MAQVFINGETRELPNVGTLKQLLEHFSLPQQRIAVELNREVISRSNWETTPVRDNDRIEIVHLVGGG